MKKTAYKVMAIGLASLLLSLPTLLSARERRGANLIITLKDGQQVKGELIAVKPDSLLFLNFAGADQSVDLVGIKSIRIVKKDKGGLGAICGLLAGWAGTLIYAKTQKGVVNQTGAALGAGLLFVPAGAVIGVVAGVMAGKDKTIQFEGKSESAVKSVLADLSLKARIRNYK
jgi:hypothetical protein